MSSRSVNVLRAVGYRYSYNRDAWVHRVGGGRFGPVFTEVADFDVSNLPEELRGRLDEQLREPSTIRMAPADDRPLAASGPLRRPGDRLIPVRWSDGDDHITVYVDGRPPLRSGESRGWQPLLVPPAAARATAPPLPRRQRTVIPFDRDRASATG